MGRFSKAFRLTDDDGNVLDIENDHLPVIDWPHQRIHDKKSFTTTFRNEVTSINEQTVIAFNAPVSDEVHLTISVESSHEANAMLYRDTSIDPSEGTQITPSNRSQIAPVGASGVLSIETIPVVNKMTTLNESQAASANITITTELDTIHLLGGGGPKALGASVQGRQEWDFSGSTQVAIVMNAETNDDAVHIIRLDYYEE